MSGYIEKVLACYGYLQPSNTQLSPHQHATISYGANTHQTAAPKARPPLDAAGVKCVQGIIVDLLWYGRAVNNKLIFSVSAIGS